MDKIIAAKAFHFELAVDNVHHLTALERQLQGYHLLFPLLEYLRVNIRQTLNQGITFDGGRSRLQKQRHMRKLVLHFNLPHLRSIGSEDVVGNIEDEVHLDRLLMSLIPVFIDLLLLLLQFICFVADEQAGNVVVIVGRGKCLNGRQVFFNPLKLLLGRYSLVLVNWRSFVDFLTLLEVRLGIELFEDIQDGVFTCPADHLLCFFGVLREDADVGRVFLASSVVLSAAFHPYERIIIIINVQKDSCFPKTINIQGLLRNIAWSFSEKFLQSSGIIKIIENKSLYCQLKQVFPVSW